MKAFLGLCLIFVIILNSCDSESNHKNTPTENLTKINLNQYITMLGIAQDGT